MKPAVIMIGYLVVTTIVAMYLLRTNKSVQEHFVAKRNLSLYLVIPLLFGECVGGAATIGNAAGAFQIGLSAGWATWGLAIGCFMIVFTVTKFYRVIGRQLGAMSVPEAYVALFDLKTRYALMFTILVCYVIFYALQPIGAAAILGPMFGVSQEAATWFVGIFFIILTITGGLRGLAWMSVIHALVKYIALGIVAYLSIKAVGGFDVLQSKLPAHFFSVMHPNVWTTIAWGFGTAVGLFSSATVAGVIYGAENLAVAKKGIFLGGLLLVPFVLFVLIIGMSAKVLVPNIAARTALFAGASSLGPWTGGLAAMGIMATILCVAPSLLLIVSTVLTRDFYLQIKKDATSEQQLMFSRVASVIVGIISILIGLRMESILYQMLGAFQIRAVAGVVLVAALMWPRVTGNAAFWAIIIGGVVALCWHVAGNPFGWAPMWPSLIASMPVLGIMTLLSSEKVSPGYLRYQVALQKLEAQGEL
ncbi:MAG: sodium:solute symporter family protein [Syntrophobacteraceae bacterium]|jgi:SSS family solute:Na+ symporter